MAWLALTRAAVARRRSPLPFLAVFLAALGASTGHLLTRSPHTADAAQPTPQPMPPISPSRGPFPVFTKPSFTMVTLGDSIMWGQGLPESMKFRAIVGDWLQSEYGGTRRVSQFNRAHSGAQIVVADHADNETGLPGEIPSRWPSITKQLADLVTQDLSPAGIAADAVDLVLLDGGINDVGVLNLLAPWHSTGFVRSAVDRQAIPGMTALLGNVRSTFKNAAVVVVGYFPIASADSDLGALIKLITALGAEGGGPNGAVGGLALGSVSKDQIVNNSTEWNNHLQAGLSTLVQQTPSDALGPRVALAWPTFPAYAAPNTGLWLVDQFAADEARGLTGTHPESQTTPGGVAYTRSQGCKAANRWNPICADASMGHPNELGSRAYADAIISQLENTLWNRLGLPHMTAEITDSAYGKPGSNGCWVVVAATDFKTHAPVSAGVTVRNAVGGATKAQGRTGERLAFRCPDGPRPAPRREPPNGPPIVREPTDDTEEVVVLARGYNRVVMTY